MVGVEKQLAEINKKLRLLLDRSGDGPRRLLTVGQAAKRLGVTAQRVRLMIRCGVLLAWTSDEDLIPASEVTRILMSAELIQSAQRAMPRLRLVRARSKR